ncbi:MAG TPA: twin-arginine translocase subunit TatC [Actinomycetota bacterium]|jgi:sec-independent protein translocase protein TatC|nr:twin-arginine translocase subunit TatC [Actinomycetota bacterium]
MRVIRRRQRRDPNEMTLVEHLEELRTRLIIVSAALVVTSIVGLVFFDPIFSVALGPYCRALESIPMENRVLKGCALVFNSPVDPFLTRLKVGFFSGFLLALPVILWQLWQFIVPGLTQRERKLSVPFVLSSLVLFAAGTVFAMLIIPRGLAFLFSFAGESLTVLLTVDRYLSFLILLVLVFGLSFEFPLLLVFLAGARIVTSSQMKQWRRYTYFGLAVFAMIATPTQDPYTMLLMWVPLIAFYEAAILVSRFFKR